MSKIKTITILAVIIASSVLTQAQGSLPKLVPTTTNTQISVSSVSESSSSLVVSSVSSVISSSGQPTITKIVKPAPVVEVKAPTNCQATSSPYVEAGTSKQDSLTRINLALSVMTRDGFSCQASVIFVGSLLQESYLNANKGNHIGCFGITQWCGGRLANLKKFCNPLGDLECQLEYFVKEIKGQVSGLNYDYKACPTIVQGNNNEEIKRCVYSYTLWGVNETGNRWNYSKAIWSQIN